MKTLSTHAAAAKAIRQELKTAFPGITFRVNSKSFSMGDDVSIHWTDGPTYDAVNKITRKYQYGQFDGMNDIYENSNDRSDIPQTKYVMLQRNYSDQAREAAKIELMSLWYLPDFNDNTVMAKMGIWADAAIYRHLSPMTLDFAGF